MGRAIASYIQLNPEVIPSEISEWPPDDGDDYIGCWIGSKASVQLSRDFVNFSKGKGGTMK